MGCHDRPAPEWAVDRRDRSQDLQRTRGGLQADRQRLIAAAGICEPRQDALLQQALTFQVEVGVGGERRRTDVVEALRTGHALGPQQQLEPRILVGEPGKFLTQTWQQAGIRLGEQRFQRAGYKLALLLGALEQQRLLVLVGRPELLVDQDRYGDEDDRYQDQPAGERAQ